MSSDWYVSPIMSWYGGKMIRNTEYFLYFAFAASLLASIAPLDRYSEFSALHVVCAEIEQELQSIWYTMTC